MVTGATHQKIGNFSNFRKNVSASPLAIASFKRQYSNDESPDENDISSNRKSFEAIVSENYSPIELITYYPENTMSYLDDPNSGMCKFWKVSVLMRKKKSETNNVMFIKQIFFDPPFIIEKTYAATIYKDESYMKQIFSEEKIFKVL